MERVPFNFIWTKKTGISPSSSIETEAQMDKNNWNVTNLKIEQATGTWDVIKEKKSDLNFNSEAESSNYLQKIRPLQESNCYLRREQRQLCTRSNDYIQLFHCQRMLHAEWRWEWWNATQSKRWHRLITTDATTASIKIHTAGTIDYRLTNTLWLYEGICTNKVTKQQKW